MSKLILLLLSHPEKAKECDLRYLLGTLLVDFEHRAATVK